MKLSKNKMQVPEREICAQTKWGQKGGPDDWLTVVFYIWKNKAKRKEKKRNQPQMQMIHSGGSAGQHSPTPNAASQNESASCVRFKKKSPPKLLQNKLWFFPLGSFKSYISYPFKKIKTTTQWIFNSVFGISNLALNMCFKSH